MSSKKEFTNLIIVDASGSMYSKKESVKNGLLELFQSIKKSAKESKDTLFNTIVVSFSNYNSINTLVDTSSYKDLGKSVIDSYDTGGMTALYDAIGYGFNLVPENQVGVFVSILTDGEENNSREYNSDTIKKLIKDKRDKSWGITFMGTTEESIESAKDMGISTGNTFQFQDSVKGVATAYHVSSRAYNVMTSSLSSSGSIDNDNLINNAGVVNDTDNGTDIVVGSAVGNTVANVTDNVTDSFEGQSNKLQEES